ncbi:DAP3 isoform 24, partial [Pan troglodytes]
RLISRIHKAKHGDQHEGQHYNISPQDLKTVFPHGLPPRFVMQVLKTGNGIGGSPEHKLLLAKEWG